mmetsp:Transcript_16880/g.26829  ORF Transcript_16880/g.26829 Transcript_16880/m.26829 type:complete len:268 (+) Transcript_16880:167-970(+)
MIGAVRLQTIMLIIIVICVMVRVKTTALTGSYTTCPSCPSRSSGDRDSTSNSFHAGEDVDGVTGSLCSKYGQKVPNRTDLAEERADTCPSLAFITKLLGVECASMLKLLFIVDAVYPVLACNIDWQLESTSSKDCLAWAKQAHLSSKSSSPKPSFSGAALKSNPRPGGPASTSRDKYGLLMPIGGMPVDADCTDTARFTRAGSIAAAGKGLLDVFTTPTDFFGVFTTPTGFFLYDMLRVVGALRMASAFLRCFFAFFHLRMASRSHR